MKKKIAKITLILFSILAISSLPHTVKAEGWIEELDDCIIGMTSTGEVIYGSVTVCDAWGGDCPDQWCCDGY